MSRRIVRLRMEKNGYEVRSIRWRSPVATQKYGFKSAMKKDPCVYCGEPSQSWEHITPKSMGGQNGWSNIARACFDCNGTRSSMPLLVFMLRKKK